MDDKRIGVRRRGRALLVDGAAIFLLWFAASLLTQALAMSPAGMSGTAAGMRGRHMGLWFLLLLTPPLAGLAYASCDVFFAASAGKAALKLRIADATGRRATRRQLVARFAIKYAWLLVFAAWVAYFAVSVAVTDGRGINAASRMAVPMLTLIGLLGLIVGVGGLWAFKPSRQALHDRLTGTAVFRRDDVTTASFEPVFEPNAQGPTPVQRT